MLFPPTDKTGARVKREIIGETITQLEIISTIVLVSTNVAPATSGLASTLTSICNYATVIRTMPVLSQVIVKLPLVDDWSEPKSTYPMRAFAPAEAPESS